MPRRYTDEEVERSMIPKLVAAIYPVLIPIEQQDVRIQAENRAMITEVALEVWRSFIARR